MQVHSEMFNWLIFEKLFLLIFIDLLNFNQKREFVIISTYLIIFALYFNKFDMSISVPTSNWNLTNFQILGFLISSKVPKSLMGPLMSIVFKEGDVRLKATVRQCNKLKIVLFPEDYIQLLINITNFNNLMCIDLKF